MKSSDDVCVLKNDKDWSEVCSHRRPFLALFMNNVTLDRRRSGSRLGREVLEVRKGIITVLRT